MSKHIRKHVWWDRWGGLLVVGSLLGGGCTAGSPRWPWSKPVPRMRKRSKHPRWSPMPLCPYRRRTKRSGGRSAWADDHDAEEVQHLATLAAQRVDIARAAAEKKVAEGADPAGDGGA